MKKLATGLSLTALTALVVLLIGTPALRAQQMGQMGGNPEAMAKLESMSQQLQLTPAQKKQVMPILMDEGPKIKALKANTTLPPAQKMMQMREIGQATDAKMKPILSPQQYEKWEVMRTQERKQMMEKAADH